MYRLLEIKNVNKHHLKRYYKLLEKYKIPKRLGQGLSERHHILPTCFYSDFIESKWNIIHIPTRVHYLLHWCLAKALGGKMWFAFNIMKRTIPGNRKNTILYLKSRQYIASAVSESNTGRPMTAINKIKMSKRTKNTVVVKTSLNSTDYFRVSTLDPKYLSGEYIYYRTGLSHKMSTIKKMKANGLSGRICYNNGNKDKFFKENEEIPNEYTSGSMKSGKPKPDNYKKRWINNGIKNKRISLYEEKPSGWNFGKLTQIGFSIINSKKLVLNIRTKKLTIKNKDYSLKKEETFNFCNELNKVVIFIYDNTYFVAKISISKYASLNGIYFPGNSKIVNNEDLRILKVPSIHPCSKNNIFRVRHEGKSLYECGFRVVKLKDLVYNSDYNIFDYKKGE